VLSIEPASSTVVVGPREMLSVDTIQLVEGISWSGGDDRRVRVQWRAHGEAVPAQVRLADDGNILDVVLDESAHGVAAGQELVAYDGGQGQRVLFSARIAGSSLRSR
jgi:tRNA-specific 2-thiouridylase